MKKQLSSKSTSRAPSPKGVRFNITMNSELLKRLDEAARQDYTSRSDIIRAAVLWYLRPHGQELNQADPDVILKTLQQRRLYAGVKKMMKDTKNS